MTVDFTAHPIDSTSAAALANQGLRFEVLDGSDAEAFAAWFQAMIRGFNGSRLADDEVPGRRDAFSHRRMVGVWDDSAADAKSPVATSSGWITDLTVPGGTALRVWAISTVTVAPTHRRKGIARGLLGAELRTAHQLGVPAAILTASEATIYTRFGFSPAAMQADWTIDTRRANWTGPTPPGRVQLVPNDDVREGVGHPLVERVRLETPGQIGFDGHLYHRLFGIIAENKGADVRVARYDDEMGEPQGFAIYKATQGEHDASITVTYLVAATDDAYSALWRYLLEIDLINSVKATLRPTVEPVQWQISDARAAVKSNETDHLWLRILDVKATLEARRYSAEGVFVLEISDDLGIADGVYLLSVDERGTGTVARHDALGGFADNSGLSMSIAELGAIYLGGVSPTTLVRAGRIAELEPGSAAAADAVFRSGVTPWLSIWF
jgi:predicted acetyltransferase